MRVLVTGGAGYIGSHTSKALALAGFEPVVFDDLSMGHRWAVRWGPFAEGNVGDRARLAEVVREYGPEAAIHFAASAFVGESMSDPRKYFRNNVTASLTLLDVLLDAGIDKLVFSSSCATYGTPRTLPITEETPQQPINPYGESKLFVERALAWYRQAYGTNWVALRYFNAAGADPEGEIGEDHTPETHLIPLVIQSALGLRPAVDVYGTDYPTADGTAVRDYIHVSDLADAHVSALRHLLAGGRSLAANLGTGGGTSVREVLEAVGRVAGRAPEARFCPRRPGDPPVLIADASLAAKVFQWTPRHSSLDAIVGSAWAWHKNHQGVPRQARGH